MESGYGYSEDGSARNVIRNLFVPYTEKYSPDGDGRVVYSTTISWDAQMEQAYNLFHQGFTPRVHRHAYGQFCVPVNSPVGGCVEISLTPDGKPRTVLLIEPEVTPSDSDEVEVEIHHPVS